MPAEVIRRVNCASVEAISAMPSVPMMKTNGDERPALPAISDEMKITPMVGEMNASEMASALGSPRAFRFSWLSLVAGGAAVGLAAAMACLLKGRYL